MNSSTDIEKPIFRTLLESRELIKVLAGRDIKVKYRDSMLGYFWAVIPQLATVLLFTLLVQKRVFNMGHTELPYILHALWSLSCWQLFSSVLMNSQQSLKSSGDLILKMNFEKVIVVIASIIPSIIDFIIRLVPIVLIAFWFQQSLAIYALIIPFMLLFMIILALGLGLILSCINLVFSDLSNIVSVLVTFGMFLSPILYPPPTAGLFALVNVVNPFSPLLIATQQLLAGNVLQLTFPLLFSLLLSLCVFIFGWHFFHNALPKVLERA